MTVKGFIRSYGAAVRRVERDQQRRAREAAKFYKQQQKEQEIANAGDAANQYAEYISVLKSIHKDCSTPIDWLKIQDEKPPKEPLLSNQREIAARRSLAEYRPGFFAKTFGWDKRTRAKLEGKVHLAIANDKDEQEKRLGQFKEESTDWKKLQDISKGIINGSVDSYEKAMLFFDPLGEIDEFGSKVSMHFFKKYVTVDFIVKSSEVIPDYILTQTSTGKLSKKAMPTSKFQELYQDYVCSAVLRISREILAYLPVKFVIVNAKAELLNSTNGQVELQPILSVAIPPTTLARLNFDTIDPSDSMKNFVNQMKFSKTSGFSPIEIIQPESINI
jgi:hypothetical protein